MLTEGSEICWGYVHDRMLDGTPKDVANPGRPADSPLGMRIRKKKWKLSEFRSIKSISYWQFSQFGPVRERERGAWVPVHVVADPGNEPAIIKISFSHRSIGLEISSQYVTVKPVIGSEVESWQHQLHLFKKNVLGIQFPNLSGSKIVKADPESESTMGLYRKLLKKRYVIKLSISIIYGLKVVWKSLQ